MMSVDFGRSIFFGLLIVLSFSKAMAENAAQSQEEVCANPDVFAQFFNLIQKNKMSKSEASSHILDEGSFEISRYHDRLTKQGLLRHFDGDISFLFPDRRSYAHLKSFVSSMKEKYCPLNEGKERTFQHQDKKYFYQMSMKQESGIPYFILHLRIDSKDDWADEMGWAESSHIYHFRYENGVLVLERILLI
ncbi:MAG: hypothetical protein LBU11_02415 [Zoogloeaceae bacterium]|nr:hypothetical protein [Zoogloeaceae bacterium]